jgi:hypothetical protein
VSLFYFFLNAYNRRCKKKKEDPRPKQFRRADILFVRLYFRFDRDRNAVIFTIIRAPTATKKPQKKKCRDRAILSFPCDWPNLQRLPQAMRTARHSRGRRQRGSAPTVWRLYDRPLFVVVLVPRWSQRATTNFLGVGRNQRSKCRGKRVEK